MSRCEDCWCGLRNWICTNCHEEYYIANSQSEYISEPLSDEFRAKVDESAKILSHKI